ncbi:MAG: ABC transporter permease [Candidatus Bathyarchaeota archaeon]|nr:ABC transporter permease [Candidatus Bathyarchaeota archaeon]
MSRYIIRRLLYLIPLFLGILIIVFAATRVAGDPVRLMTALNPYITEEAKSNLVSYYGLDQPLYTQFFIYLSQLFQGDLGNSYAIRGGIEVTSLIGDYIGPTIQLQVAAMLFALIIAIPVGIISAKKKYSKLDMTVTTTSLLGTCIPVFYMGIIAILIFGYFLGWFPAGGLLTQVTETRNYFLGNQTLDILWHMTIPTGVLTFAILAPIVLLIRSSMLEVLKQDYILAARASGLSERVVIYKHALRNALIPVVTWVGIYFGGMLAGAPITETVFNWPGVGRLFVQATTKLDFPVIMGITVVITIMTLIVNLITDLTYGYIDPRIRME